MGNNILCKWIPSVLLYNVCKVTGTLFHMDVVINMVFLGGKCIPYFSGPFPVGEHTPWTCLHIWLAQCPICSGHSLLQTTQHGSPLAPCRQQAQAQSNCWQSLILAHTHSSIWLPWGLSYLETVCRAWPVTNFPWSIMYVFFSKINFNICVLWLA